MKKWINRTVLSLAFALLVVPAAQAEGLDEKKDDRVIIMKTDPEW
ncbi:hypothetical protein SD939_10580 [Lactobacillus crispatus]|nr:hypothetical protein [Lactobacillus crispatus]MDX5091648.1 hypothetical protein [Lactobacillus crispatus]